MYPDLIDIGFLHLKTYGMCMALGFIAAVWVLNMISSRRDLADLMMYLLISGVIGSRIAYVIENWRQFSLDFFSVFRVWEGGLVFYGGLILSLIVFVCWVKAKGENFLRIADLFAVVLPLGHAFGRIGCFFYGCCYGKISESSLAVVFPRHSPAWFEQLNNGLIDAEAQCSLPVLPTELFESAALLVLFAVLLLVYRRYKTFTAGLYLIGYGVLRFCMEYLRGDPRAAVGPFSIGQTISFGIVALGIGILTYGRKKHSSDNR